MGIAISYPPEYRDLKTNDFVLTRLAERTGGRVLKDPSDVFGEGRKPARMPVEIWPTLLLAALLLFPLNVALRRVMIEPAEVWQWARGRAVTVRHRRKAAAAPARQPTLGRLLDRKSQSPTRRGDGPVRQAARAEAPAPATAAPHAGAEALSEAAEQPGAAPTAPAPAAAAPKPSAPAEEDDEAGLSPTERLLRAKRRARGG